MLSFRTSNVENMILLVKFRTKINVVILQKYVVSYFHLVSAYNILLHKYPCPHDNNRLVYIKEENSFNEAV